MEAIADSMEWSLRVLNLYLSTEEGLLLVAQCELATAVRTRIAAAAQLHNAIDALGTMLQEYAHCARRTLVDERKHTTHVLREEQRANARRAAHLLFRLAHFTPRPIRAYTPVPPPLSGGGAEALRGGGGSPALTAPALQPLAPHAEGVEVNSRGSPRRGTPGDAPIDTAHRAAVLVPHDAQDGVVRVPLVGGSASTSASSPSTPPTCAREPADASPNSHPLHAEGVDVHSRGSSERVFERTRPTERGQSDPDPERVIVTPNGRTASRSTDLLATSGTPP